MNMQDVRQDVPASVRLLTSGCFNILCVLLEV